MRRALDHDITPCCRVIAAAFFLALLSLACRVALTAAAGRSTVVMSISDWLGMMTMGAAIVALGLYIGSSAIGTLGFGVGMIAVAFMYLPDATEAALHFGRSFAYADAPLTAADRVLAFDWPTYALWLDGHPTLWTWGRYAYLSMPALPLVVVVVVSLDASTHRLATFFVAQLICLTACAGIAVFVPALGAYDHFGATSLPFAHHDFVTAAHMTKSLEWLRQPTLVGDGVVYHGLVSFPSFHAMSCVLDGWATWRSRWARYPMAALTLLILVATPVQGSHYLVDVVAGIGIAILAIRPSAWLVTTLAAPRRAVPASSVLIPA